MNKSMFDTTEEELRDMARKVALAYPENAEAIARLPIKDMAAVLKARGRRPVEPEPSTETTSSGTNEQNESSHRISHHQNVISPLQKHSSKAVVTEDADDNKKSHRDDDDDDDDDDEEEEEEEETESEESDGSEQIPRPKKRRHIYHGASYDSSDQERANEIPSSDTEEQDEVMPAANDDDEDLSHVSGASMHSNTMNGNISDQGALIDDEDDTYVEDRSSEEVIDKEDYQRELDRVRKSTLTLALQGFRAKLRGQASNVQGNCSFYTSNTDAEGAPKEPEFVTYQGRKYNKGRCYHYKETGKGGLNVLVGITGFLPNNFARCKLIVPFEETFLGKIEESESQVIPFIPSLYVQICEEIPPLHLQYFEKESANVKNIPRLVYEPQTEDAWQSFAYYFESEPRRRGRRESFGVVELFAGCGGMHLGFRRAGFDAAKLVEIDRSAVETLTTNNNHAPVFQGDVNDFIKRCERETFRNQLGEGNHLHSSSPCCGFSGANRTGGQNDEANNDLSFTIVKAAKLLQPPTLSFENVVGMWRRKHIYYLVSIITELLKMRYQVRCCVLKARDYGDPQKRERLFIFASKDGVPLPKVPPKTHGSGPNLQPFTTNKDVLSPYHHIDAAEKKSIPNMQGRSASLDEDDDTLRLDADGQAPTIRAKGAVPFHYEEGRCINVREAATLQSFPRSYNFCGTLTEQYQQVGNAVPVELASAVAHSVRQSLMFHYEGND